MVNEGGGLHVDGAGTVLLTDTVQRDPGRNAGWSREQVEGEVHRLLGTTTAVWLPRGLTRDYGEFGTRGHVDIVATFVRPGVVAVHHQPDPAHPDHEVTAELHGLLRAARDADGRSLEVVPVPAPAVLEEGDDWVDYSYINHYVGNSVVVVGTFDDPRDDDAVALLSRLYPGRRVERADDLEQFWGDIIAAYGEELRRLGDLGCPYLQFDDTSLAMLADPSQRRAHRGARRRRRPPPHDLHPAPQRCDRAEARRAWRSRPTPAGATTAPPTRPRAATTSSPRRCSASWPSTASSSSTTTSARAASSRCASCRKGKMVVLGLVTTKRGELETKDELKRRDRGGLRAIVADRPAVPFAAVRVRLDARGQRALAAASRRRSYGWSSRPRRRSGAERVLNATRASRWRRRSPGRSRGPLVRPEPRPAHLPRRDG